jgi:hypothetical protein
VLRRETQTDKHFLANIHHRVSKKIVRLEAYPNLAHCFSRAGSMGTGLPHAIKDAEITTVFPRPLKEFEDVGAQERKSDRVHGLTLLIYRALYPMTPTRP